ncbi:Putative Site-specific recombinase XerD (fragment) [Cupriavidus taiwanensis]
MLLANPLRLRNYIIMQHHNGGGHLYARQDGQWRLRFIPSEFKNEHGAARSAYDAPLPLALSNRIVDYLTEYRPRLVQKHPNTPWVFPSSRSDNPWRGLSNHVYKLTKRYIPETLGFAEHSFRHLVATDYLRKHPEDYLTVAQLLNDKLETVLREYAHLRHDDSFGRYERHLAAIPK